MPVVFACMPPRIYHGFVEGTGITNFSIGGGNGVCSSGPTFVGVVRPEVVAVSTLCRSLLEQRFNVACMVGEVSSELCCVVNSTMSMSSHQSLMKNDEKSEKNEESSSLFLSAWMCRRSWSAARFVFRKIQKLEDTFPSGQGSSNIYICRIHDSIILADRVVEALSSLSTCASCMGISEAAVVRTEIEHGLVSLRLLLHRMHDEAEQRKRRKLAKWTRQEVV